MNCIGRGCYLDFHWLVREFAAWVVDGDEDVLGVFVLSAHWGLVYSVILVSIEEGRVPFNCQIEIIFDLFLYQIAIKFVVDGHLLR